MFCYITRYLLLYNTWYAMLYDTCYVIVIYDMICYVI